MVLAPGCTLKSSRELYKCWFQASPPHSWLKLESSGHGYNFKAPYVLTGNLTAKQHLESLSADHKRKRTGRGMWHPSATKAVALCPLPCLESDVWLVRANYWIPNVCDGQEQGLMLRPSMLCGACSTLSSKARIGLCDRRGTGPAGGRQVAQLWKEMGSRCQEPDGTLVPFNEHAVNLAHFWL